MCIRDSLPFIKSKIVDGSFSGGLKGNAAGWRWDLGTVYGRNTFDFTIDNSANVSLGPTSKTTFDAGQLAFGQSTTSLDLFREVSSPFASPIRVAVGGEFRDDMYKITCLLYTSDAADERSSVDLGGRR